MLIWIFGKLEVAWLTWAKLWYHLQHSPKIFSLFSMCHGHCEMGRTYDSYRCTVN